MSAERIESIDAVDVMVGRIQEKTHVFRGERTERIAFALVERNDDGTRRYTHIGDKELIKSVYADVLDVTPEEEYEDKLQSFTGAAYSAKKILLKGLSNIRHRVRNKRAEDLFLKLKKHDPNISLESLFEDFARLGPSGKGEKPEKEAEIGSAMLKSIELELVQRSIHSPSPRRKPRRVESNHQRAIEPQKTVSSPGLSRADATKLAQSILRQAEHAVIDTAPPPEPKIPAHKRLPLIAPIVFSQSPPPETLVQKPDFDDAQFLLLAAAIVRLNMENHYAGVSKTPLRLSRYEIELLTKDGKRLIKENPGLKDFPDSQPELYLTLDYFIAHRDSFKIENAQRYSVFGRSLMRRLNISTAIQLRDLQIEASVKPLQRA